MSQTKPFKRTIRPHKNDGYLSSNVDYICHSDYAKSPDRFVHSYLLLIKDINELFEYVEPSFANKETYSYRIHELFIRTCIEVEANFRAILVENGYTKKSNFNIDDYKLVNQTHKLSDYLLILPRWEKIGSNFRPFRCWSNIPKGRWWYQYYNDVKHDIHNNFKHANLKNLIEAISGLTALICSQFYNEDFTPKGGLIYSYIGNDLSTTTGNMFLVQYPNWNKNDQYDFNWNKLKEDKVLFQTHDYNKLKKAQNNTSANK